jgi:hypothetical protein
MEPYSSDLGFSGQTKQTCGYLLFLLVGSSTEGNVKLGNSQVIHLSCPVLENGDDLTFHSIEVAKAVY